MQKMCISIYCNIEKPLIMIYSLRGKLQLPQFSTINVHVLKQVNNIVQQFQWTIFCSVLR